MPQIEGWRVKAEGKLKPTVAGDGKQRDGRLKAEV
jgi:hypothetical protein